MGTPTPGTAARSAVTAVPAADPARAIEHFAELLSFETDCWDVHAALSAGTDDFLLVDVRGRGGWAAGHVDGAVHVPHAELTVERLADVPMDRLVVVYCAGPHCNGADRAALRLAGLGRPVKKMIGGVTGWLDEGFSLVSEDTEHAEDASREVAP
ncbi:rhodanese-like domain-containing protein [Salsipaludibacter albus]|uniref:rhodanese-like domain-containing protein n=1 Tax=Salsipaludibacter albus TaxID=2849650 RepID=UPI001EE4497A|nr:rhodanese-like domain-containing protein [Salsipaludibacter albus]MBY5162623.1 rhodanese-like domain-containing protein [Salsipaludibacter albus]